MSNVVLAVLTRVETAPVVLAAAARLAALAGGARIEALVMRQPPLSTILVTEEILTAEQEQRIREQENQRATALHGVFAAWAAGQPSGDGAPRWINEEGAAEALVKRWGARADYIVVAQPPAQGSHGEHDALHAALFSSERPVLMVPPGARTDFGKTVAVAWRDDKFTLHAVMEALHCVPKVAAVHVLMGRRAGAAAPRIPDVLLEHGVEVSGHELPVGTAVFGAQLLAKAHEVNADLLVMGAFVHQAWRSLLFGGVTRYMLAHADLPVLMRH
ncbi:universal stress protein [Acidocella sp. KAb 2-4]|uniref:universal stress protein n=1 Tax=Acidocella sp. KAb 2-4 TaxID=2885158 RepID=UPI001D060886|nr:universal stress protein [Acidocella sp. KAb 2-4]MCB5943963.1 universal stress protein [Acidocella sp. KAb 2-4]